MGEKVETVADFMLGSKITGDSNYSHEIKKHLLLGRKNMTNLDSMLKSRDITIADKAAYNQSYGFSSIHIWMWELAECQRMDAFELWCWRRLLKSALDSKEIKLVNTKKKINHEYSLEGLMLKLKVQYFGHLLQRANSLGRTLMLGKIEGRRRRGWQRMKWLDSIANSMDMNLTKLQEIVKGREVWLAAVHRVLKRRIRLSNSTTKTHIMSGRHCPCHFSCQTT